MSPRRKRNSFESSLPVASSSCSTSAATSLPTVASAPALVPGTSASVSIDFARIFSFGYSAHSDTDFGHRTAVVTYRGWRSFSFYARPSRHFCSRVAGVNFGQSGGTFGRLWHAPALNHKRGISVIDCCWVPASECFDLVHFSASGIVVKRFARYVIVSFCSTFCLCVFLR